MRRVALTLLACLAACPCLAAAGKPVLVVFKFERSNCRAKDSRFVTKGIYDKADRLDAFAMIDPMSRDDVVAAAGLEPKLDTPIEQIAGLIKDAFQAHIGLWGKVHKEGQHYTISARCLDVRESASKLKFDLTYKANGPREVRAQLEKIVDALGARKQVKETVRFREEKLNEPDPSATRPNLVKNGDFEAGHGDQVAHWWRVNGLTTFWVDAGDRPGKCIKIDSDVLESEVLPWLKRWQAGAPASRAPQKTVPKQSQQYATIAGTHGVHYKSEPIPITPGMRYRLSVDMKGRWTGIFVPRVFIKGFAQFKDPKGFGDQERVIIKPMKLCRTTTAGREWEHFTMTFTPTQALVVLDFEAGPGQERLAAAIPAAIREHIRSADAFPMVPDSLLHKAAQKSGYKFSMDDPLRKVLDFSAHWLNASLVLYGSVKQVDGQSVAIVRATDLRRKQYRPMFDIHRPVPAQADVDQLTKDVVAKFQSAKKVVKWVRVELYSYWPRGVYYWDNVRITEEGPITTTE